MSYLPHRRRPCAECPWRRDVAPGQFPAERFEALKNTVQHSQPQTVSDVVEQPLFACHKSSVGREEACAGFLAVAGGQNLAVRLAWTQGRIPAHALRPGEDWPPLFETYEEMARTQGAVSPDDGERE
ncbi:DUF6283 family protein [Streptomyces rimosus]|uniref:DUF6283 family protein n=1 Tax=Streptomyces rimosus TaxID=1927 RepID=UPI0018FF0345|nr:DUF6283 family protein [Streptomyces rimosus]